MKENLLIICKFSEGSGTGMAKVDLKTQKKTEIEDSSSLKGTLASVFLLGIFLVVTWVSVYFLFLDRF